MAKSLKSIVFMSVAATALMLVSYMGGASQMHDYKVTVVMLERKLLALRTGGTTTSEGSKSDN